ncbi:hypothetical protein F7Q99_26430 [Streptomyces kaniharaensis]|uniref:Peptide deformylase n=1 Tax=Streptomyces kaniharaensis TaxID=212423 RepID=A0A6N7KW07_9ACTN|nr:hypothetical protein [Streptomyces kaniharaensis]
MASPTSSKHIWGPSEAAATSTARTRGTYGGATCCWSPATGPPSCTSGSATDPARPRQPGPPPQRLLSSTTLDDHSRLLVRLARDYEGPQRHLGSDDPLVDEHGHEPSARPAITKDGNPLVIEGKGYFARCLQHETDHLEGQLYMDRLSKRDRKDTLRQTAERREAVFARRTRRAAELDS